MIQLRGKKQLGRGILFALLWWVGAISPLLALNPKVPLKWATLEQWEDLNRYSGGATFCIFQGRDGYLWFGTEKGLIRYDGTNFDQFNNRTVSAFRANDVVDIAEGLDGSLWIATMGGLIRYKNGPFRRYGTEDGLPTIMPPDCWWIVREKSGWELRPVSADCGGIALKRLW